MYTLTEMTNFGHPVTGWKENQVFPACHSASWSWHLLAQTSFQLAPKAFCWAELISHFFCYSDSSKNITCPSGKLKTDFTLARQQNPLAPGYPTLLSLHAAVSTVRTVTVYQAGGYCFKPRPDQQPWALKKHVQSCWPLVLNPSSPNIHIQILQTDLHTFPWRISWENLVKDQIFFSLWSFC